MSTESTTGVRVTDEWLTEHLDLNADELAPVFHESMARLRSRCPVAHSDQYGGYWIVTKYDDVFRVAQDWETFSSEHGLSIPPPPAMLRNIPVEVDPPLQRVYKRMVNPFFTPAVVSGWEEGTRALASQLVDEFVERGECEFMDMFARPFPSLAFFKFALDAPADEIERVAYMASKSSTPTDPEAAECWAGLSKWIEGFLEARGAQPSNGEHDFVEGVLGATVEGRPITHDEVVGTVQLAILGGLETTTGALGLMMVRFCRQPEIPALLRERPELLEEAIEELLRLDGPFIAIGRMATRDAEVGGRHIKKGERVLLYWASADRDEDEFANPDAFDLERGSNRHLAFGVGPHRCLGSNLARMNLRVALGELLARLDDIKLQEGADVHYHSTLTRAPLSVPITFKPSRRIGASA
jgi:cytochrome P450